MTHTSSSSKATVSEIARHFGLSNDTTRAILNSAGTKPVSTHPQKYRWTDIWTLEGAEHVEPGHEEDFRRPLLNVAEVRRRFLPHLEVRAIRARASKGQFPGIKLGTDWRFRECDARKASIHG